MTRKFARLLALYIIMFSFIFFLILNNSYTALAAEANIYMDAKGAILIEQHSGKVLYEKNTDQKFYPASTTKILTALVALENGNLDDTITVGEEVLMVPWDSSKAYLQEGEQITLRDLLYGLLLPSGNDAANTIAVYIARKIANDMSLDETEALNRFADLMNERAKQAGATNSNFVNPHGYHDDNHYTTARDMALIAREAMKIDFFKEVVSTYKYNSLEKPVFLNGIVQESANHYWKNSNELINPSSKNYYEYSTGIKTGYTENAGYCIVSSASKDDMDLIAVVMDSSNHGRWDDPVKLFEYGFENYGYYEGVAKDEEVYTLKVDNHSSNSPSDLIAVPDEDYIDTLYKEEALRIKKSIVWDENIMSPIEGEQDKVKLLSSVEAGQIIGKMIFTLDNSVIKEINLKAMEGVKKQGIMNTSNVVSFLIGVVCGAVGMLILLKVTISKRRRARYRYKSFDR